MIVQYKKLNEMVELCGDLDPVVACLSITSASLMFKDIIPGYAIRENDAEEDEDRVCEYSILRSHAAFHLLLTRLFF